MNELSCNIYINDLKNFLKILLVQILIFLPTNGLSIELMPRIGHSGWVNSVDFYPDKHQYIVASAGKDGTIKFWDINERENETEIQKPLVNNITAHQKEIFCIRFSPDKKYIASASADKTIKVWNVQTGECVQIFKGHKKAVTCVDFSPDAKYLVSGSYDHTIKIWSIKEQKPVIPLLEDNPLLGDNYLVSSVKYSIDGKYIISTSKSEYPQKNKILIWDTIHYKPVQSIPIESDIFSSITVSNKYLALGVSNTIYLWEIETGSQISIIKNDNTTVNSVCFSSDYQYLYSASDNQKIIKWNMFDRSKIQELTDNTNFIKSLAIHPKGNVIVSGGKDNSVKAWNLETKENIKSIDGYSYNIFSIDYSPDGKCFVTGNYDQTIKVWDSHSASLVETLTNHNALVKSVNFSPNGKYLASGSADNKINIWDTANWSVLASNQLTSDKKPDLLSLSFCPDNTHVASCGYDHNVQIWKLEKEKLILVQTLKGHTSDVWSVSFNNDGELLASSSSDNMIIIWNWKEGKQMQKLGHLADVWSTEFSPDVQYIASGGSDNLVKIWSIKKQQLFKELKGHEGGVRSLCFSPDGKYLASGDESRLINIWNLNTFNLVCSLTGHTAIVTSLSFSPDSNYLLSCAAEYILFQNILCGDNTIKMWETKAWDNSMNIIVLPQNEWLAYKPGKLYYNSSEKGDTYAAIRFQTFPQNVYSLNYYKKELKKEFFLSENKMPSIKPKWIKRTWGQFRIKDDIMLYTTIFLTILSMLLIISYLVKRQKIPDKFDDIKKYFNAENYTKPIKINNNMILMKNKLDNPYAFIYRVNNSSDNLGEIESYMSSISSKTKYEPYEIYLIYKDEEAPKLEYIHNVRKKICKDIIPISLSEIKKTSDDSSFKKIRYKHTIADDPYIDYSPIDNPTFFYGRSKIKEHIIHHLTQRQHVGIFGVRKSGKTSLISQIKNHFVDIPHVHLNLDEKDIKAETIFRDILKGLDLFFENKGLHLFFRNKGIVPLPDNIKCDSSTFKSQFDKYWKSWKKNKPIESNESNNPNEPFILMFDEIDKVFPYLKEKYSDDGKLDDNTKNNIKEFIDILRVLRGLTETNESCLAILVAGFRPDGISVNRVVVSKEPFKRLDQNPLFSIIQKNDLKFLTENESETMIQEIGQWKSIYWEKGAAKDVFKYCGGYPSATRFFASMICEKGKQKKISKERVYKNAQFVMNNYDDSNRNLLLTIYNGIIEDLTKNEKLVLNKFKTRSEINSNDFPGDLKKSLKNLIFYGLINDNNGQLSIFCLLFQSYIEQTELNDM
jgi:WD40 repeat protein